MYALATNIVLVPFSRIAGPLQQVFFPAFSRMGDDRPRMADTWIRATRLVGVISIPALVGLVVVAPDFVDVVLGPKWVDATPVIQILALVGLIQSLQTLCGEVLLALGRANWLLRFTALWFVASLASFAVGVRWGVVGVAACYAMATVLVEPVRTYLTARALGTSPWRLVVALSGRRAGGRSHGRSRCSSHERRSSQRACRRPARLAILVVVGGVVYVACCLWRAPEVVVRDPGRARRQAAVDAGRGRRRSMLRSSGSNRSTRSPERTVPTDMGTDALRSYDRNVVDEAVSDGDAAAA